MKLLSYVYPGALLLYVLSNFVLVGGLIIGNHVLLSPFACALAATASLAMAWPLASQLGRVGWSVVVHGKWPVKQPK